MTTSGAWRRYHRGTCRGRASARGLLRRGMVQCLVGLLRYVGRFRSLFTGGGGFFLVLFLSAIEGIVTYWMDGIQGHLGDLYARGRPIGYKSGIRDYSFKNEQCSLTYLCIHIYNDIISPIRHVGCFFLDVNVATKRLIVWEGRAVVRGRCKSTHQRVPLSATPTSHNVETIIPDAEI